MVDLSIAMLVHQRVDQLSYGFDAGGRITLLVASILNCRAPVESAPYPVREFPILAQYLWMNCVNWIGNVGISMDVLLLSYCIPYFCMFPQSISFGIYVCQLSKLVERKDLQEPPHGFLRLSLIWIWVKTLIPDTWFLYRKTAGEFGCLSPEIFRFMIGFEFWPIPHIFFFFLFWGVKNGKHHSFQSSNLC